MEVHDIVCGKIQIAVDDITKLTPKDDKNFYGVKGSNCMITVRVDADGDEETYYFTKATIDEIQAVTGEIKPKKKAKTVKKEKKEKKQPAKQKPESNTKTKNKKPK